MPFYEYECQGCGHHLEAMQKISDAPLKKCPDCGKPRLRRLVSAPVFRLKGSGWYETDFKGDKDPKRNLADRPEPDAAGDKKPAEAAKSDAKAEPAKGEGKAESAKKVVPVAKVKAGARKPAAGKPAGARPATRKAVRKSAASPKSRR